MASFILGLNVRLENDAGEAVVAVGGTEDEIGEGGLREDEENRVGSCDKSDDPSTWTLDRLRSYVAFVKVKCQPQLTENANLILKQYYRLQRGSDHRNAARTTVKYFFL